MSGRPVQNSSGKRKDICREPRAWGNQSCSPFQPQEPLKHRCLQEISTLRPKEFWPGGRVSHFRGRASARLCRTPASKDSPAPPGPRDRSPKDGAGVWLVSPTWPGLLKPYIPVARSQVFSTRLLASPMPAAWKGPCFSLFLTADVATWFLARGSGCRSLAGLPIYLLFLAQGATRERYVLLPTPSAWEQGTRLGAQAQILAVPCC